MNRTGSALIMSVTFRLPPLRRRAAIRTNAICRAVALLMCFAVASLPRPAAAAEPATKIKIAFAGDSIVDNYWSGISRIIAASSCMRNTVELGRFAKNGTGLTRGDRLYWPREIRRIGESFKPNLIVVSLGVNDRQFIVDGAGKRTAWGSPDWSSKYLQEVDEFLNSAVATKAALLWIGLPVMRESVDNTDAQEKNQIYADAIAKLGESKFEYIEPWKLNASGSDTYSSYGPDRSGRMVQIRTADGQHFTVAGEDLAAAYLYPKIVAAFSRMGIRLDQCTKVEANKEN
jgi:uncharacterized protein